MDGSEDRMIPAVFRNTSMAHRGSSGQRISRAETKLTEGPGGETAETTRTGYYYQDGAVLYTRDADGRRSSMNLLGTSANIIATSRGTGDSESWYLYNKDIRESTTSLTAADGSAAATYEYDDFGGTTVTSGADLDNEICYTGQIYDQSSGLYYYNARFYDPENARFLTQDTYRGEADQPDTLHLYAYCKNNPINYVDPSGHSFLGFWSSKQNYFAYNQNAPQKYLGYYDVYDYAANYFGMRIGSFKVATKKWKIEFWKGQYGEMNGYSVSSCKCQYPYVKKVEYFNVQ